MCTVVRLHVDMFTISHITCRQTALHAGPSFTQCQIASSSDAIRHHQLNSNSKINSCSANSDTESDTDQGLQQQSLQAHSGDVILAQPGTTDVRNVATVISSEIKLICGAHQRMHAESFLPPC